jgi:ComEC/Rec2-related protein
MKPPLCVATLLYLGGILAGEWTAAPLGILFALAFGVGLAALGWEKRRGWCLAVFLFLAGWANLGWRTAVLSPFDLRLATGSAGRLATVRGTLRASPALRVFERQGRELWHSSVEIDLQEIRWQDEWKPADGKIIAFAPFDLSSNYFSGQMVEADGVLAALPGPRAPGLFDAQSYYRYHGIDFELRTESSRDWRHTPGEKEASSSIGDRVLAWGKRTLARGLDPEDQALHLIWTLVLDWKAPLTEAVEEPFMRAGTFHIFAVDGLRIGLLAGIGLALLRALRLPRAACGCLVVPFIWAYVGLTGWPVSAIRAAIMITIVILGWAGRRPIDLVNSIFAAAFIILLWEPRQLFQAGFQLSFVVVLGIALFHPVIKKRLQSWVFRPDPMLPDELRPRWPEPLHWAAVFAVDVCAVSLAAWLGSAPLAAVYFHWFSPVSVPANILVVPITALALMCAVGSLLCGAVLPGVTILFNHAGWFFMKTIIALSAWCAHWPLGSLNVAQPMSVTIALYYLGLIFFMTEWFFTPRWKAAVLTVLGVLGLAWLALHLESRHVSRLYCLSLEGGSAVFAENAPLGKNVLFDCGNAKMAEAIVKPLLRAQGVNRLDLLVLTVAHAAQNSGAEVVLTNFATRRVCIGPAPALSAPYRATLRSIQDLTPPQVVQEGREMQGWRVLYPPSTNRFPAADDNALVWEGDINGHAILLLSTLGRAGQDFLLTTHPDLRAEVVIAALPARDEPLSEPLLEQLQPRLIILLDADVPTHRAEARLRERLTASPATVIYGHDTGSVELDLTPGGWKLRDAAGKVILAAPNH